MIQISEADQPIFNSPNPGHELCKCSRCGINILKGDILLILWPTQSNDRTFRPSEIK